ncbi:hypothetical protein ANRL3_00445 [Anaerolineae bacterium]|nr:hypothetical protein ANRL3_00445 [Anaerolineae bacterium]
MLALNVLTFGFALWLGFYLLARNSAKPLLRLTSFGLLAYALGLAGDILSGYATGFSLTRLSALLYLLPAVFWSGALLYLLPEETPLRARLVQLWEFGLAPITALVCLAGIGTNLVFDFTAETARVGVGYLAFAALALLILLACLGLAIRTLRTTRPKSTLGFLLVVTLFFTLSIGLLFSSFDWLSRSWVALAVGLDLELLGFAIAVLDAFGEGETLLPDMARSFAAAFFAALIFGGLVTLTMLANIGISFATVALLLATVSMAIAMQTFANAIETGLDRLVFARFPRLRQARDDLRVVSTALPRARESLDPGTLAPGEFARLTRQALSHLGDLPHLAASPLARLPIIARRLAARGANDNALERAAELKALLTESIARLKPRGKDEFGTSDEWRHYNALYFPYIGGLRPYSQRADHAGLKPIEQNALDWFRANVPERTLYNWQSSAAKLVAEDLAELHRNWQ